MRAEHAAPAKLLRFPERFARGRTRVLAQVVAAHDRDQTLEGCDLPGFRGPAPGPFELVERPRRKLLGAELQDSGAGHREALAGLLGAPDGKVLFEPHILEPEPGAFEQRLQGNVHLPLFHLQAKQLQADRAFRLRHQAERARADHHAGWLALPPVRDQQTPPHVQDAAVEQRVARASQQALAVQADPHAEPVGSRDQRRNGRLRVGRVEQSRNVGAGP